MTERITAYALMEQLNMQDNIQNKNGFLRSGWTILIVMLLYYALLYFRILSGSDCPDCIINRHR